MHERKRETDFLLVELGVSVRCLKRCPNVVVELERVLLTRYANGNALEPLVLLDHNGYKRLWTMGNRVHNPMDAKDQRFLLRVPRNKKGKGKKERMNERVSEEVSKGVSKEVSKRVNKRMNEQMNEQMKERSKQTTKITKERKAWCCQQYVKQNKRTGGTKHHMASSLCLLQTNLLAGILKFDSIVRDEDASWNRLVLHLGFAQTQEDMLCKHLNERGRLCDRHVSSARNLTKTFKRATISLWSRGLVKLAAPQSFEQTFEKQVQ